MAFSAQMRSSPVKTGSDTTTHGLRVQVTPGYLPDHSDPAQDRYVFGYRVRMTNQSEQRVKLLSRHWDIVDADGVRQTVDGEGVIGQQPELAPGESFEYASHCPLQTGWGTMEGVFTFVVRAGANEGLELPVRIGRFYLVSLIEPVARN